MSNQGDQWRSQPLFDQSCYDQLNEQTGGAAAAIAEVFRRLLPERREALLRALEQSDPSALARTAHVTKSGAFSLGLLRLAEYCAAIERLSSDEIAAKEAAAEFGAAAGRLDELLRG